MTSVSTLHGRVIWVSAVSGFTVTDASVVYCVARSCAAGSVAGTSTIICTALAFNRFAEVAVDAQTYGLTGSCGSATFLAARFTNCCTILLFIDVYIFQTCSRKY